MAILVTEALDRLTDALAAGRLAHAYLVSGSRGSGKSELISRFAAQILDAGSPQVDRHPDFHSEGPESKSRRILVEQIRRLEHSIREKPSRGAAKVAVIRDADRMQPQAANAFLKTLEEPPPGTHLFLTTSAPGALLDTIVSRCILIQLRSSDRVARGSTEQMLVDTLESLITDSPAKTRATTRAFRLARTFLDAISAERESIRNEQEAAFKIEQAHYKQTTDGSWLEEREDQMKALIEAGAVRRRAEMLQAIAGWFADVLRLRNQADPIYPSPGLDAASRILTTTDALRAVSAIENTAADLDRNVHEALAVESGFLRLFQTIE